MFVSKRSALRVFASAAMTLGALVAVVSTAAATPQEDTRAEHHQGDIEHGDCGAAGLAGQWIETTHFSFGYSENQSVISISRVDSEVTVSGIVVSAGGAAAGYNVYVPGDRGLPVNPPWKELHAPLDGDDYSPFGGFFLCGTIGSGEPSPTTTTTTESTTTSSPSSTTREQPSTQPTEPTSTEPTESTTTSSGAVTTTTEAAVSPAGDSGDLAATGFSGGCLVGLGGALLVGGGALLALTRARRGKA